MPNENNTVPPSQPDGGSLSVVAGSALSFRIRADWERMEITIRGQTLELNQSQVLALHAATGESLGLLAQTIEGQCEACAGPTRGAEICPDCVENSRHR